MPLDSGMATESKAIRAKITRCPLWQGSVCVRMRAGGRVCVRARARVMHTGMFECMHACLYL